MVLTMRSILLRLWVCVLALSLCLGTASGGYVEPTSHGDGTLIPRYGQGKAVVKEVVEQGVKQGMKLGSAILDATRALPAPSGGVITDASKMLPWNGGGASSFVKAGDEWLSPSFTNSTEWFHDGWRGGEAARAGAGAGDDMVTVFRGVHAEHPQLGNAFQGRAAPMGGHSSAARHNAGDNASVFTSWTTDYSTAVNFATGSGPGGVVLRQTVPRSSLIRSPDDFLKFEVLRQGPIEGATPIILSR
jgi:hypothetical protein